MESIWGRPARLQGPIDRTQAVTQIVVQISDGHDLTP
jgi:hypothetical protein